MERQELQTEDRRRSVTVNLSLPSREKALMAPEGSRRRPFAVLQTAVAGWH